MVQAGYGLDTPRTNLGDATYLTNQPDFDISQEASFQSPSKDKNNLIEQLKNGRRGAIRTPRVRAALGDRKNMPPMGAGGEFTPLLKSATRNSAMRFGKENGVPATPAFLKPGGLDNIAEGSPLPHFGSSVYSNGSYAAGTPLPVMDTSSVASTPMALPPRRGGKDVLQNDNQLSLREQENVIDKIEKENFGLKLKIHFLEQALKKAGPGFSEAALKENTDLKVDKVTMQKELLKCRKSLSNAEKDLEDYRLQMIEMQERSKRKHQTEDQREELKLLQHGIEQREKEVEDLKRRLEDAENDALQVDKLRDEIGDLEADLREKDRLLDDRDEEVEGLQSQLKEKANTVSELEDQIKIATRREVELEEQVQSGEELEDAKETIDELERDIKNLRAEVQEAKELREKAESEKERAISDLEELQDEIANKSMTTKGLSRQMEEKAGRLQDELEDLREAHTDLRAQYDEKVRESESLASKIAQLQSTDSIKETRLREDFKVSEQARTNLESQLRILQEDVRSRSEEKSLLQSRHDALTGESAGLQNELEKARDTIEDLEDKLDHEKTLALQSEREIRDQYKTEIDRLSDDIEDLRAEIREKERLHDDDIDKWDSERRNLEAQKDQANEKASGLQRTLDKLQNAESTLHGKEFKLQEALESENQRHASEEALLKRQIDELKQDIETRRVALDELRVELSSVKEELRLSQREQKAFAEKIESLEDEIEVLQTNLDDESEQARNDVEAAKRDARTLREELYVAKLEVQKAQSAAGEPRESSFFRDNLNSRLEEIEDQLQKVRKEKQGVVEKHAELMIEVATVKANAVQIESERDELALQMRDIQSQGEHTSRLDQEKLELRTAKTRLENELRRAKDKELLLAEQLQISELELQQETATAAAEEARLNNVNLELKKKLSAASSDRELQTSKRTIQALEQQVAELEAQQSSGVSPRNSSELTIFRHDLAVLRQKETDYLSREAAQKDSIRTLKRQINNLERQSHDLEVSQLQSRSPNSSSASTSAAHKADLQELRTQLAAAHRSLKDVRSQHKESEREAARKLSSLNLEMQALAASWDMEKDRLEADLDSALVAKDNMSNEKMVLEQTITRLRSKISHLEKELSSSRRATSHDTTMAIERSELHEMLRETQIRASELELDLVEREKQVERVTSKEADLRVQLRRVRDERAGHKERASEAIREMKKLEHAFSDAVNSWEEERKRLTSGVRFANQSFSDAGANRSVVQYAGPDDEKTGQAEKRHMKELRGLVMQIQWLQALVKREEGLRSDAAFAKKYMEMQIDMFEACNKADLSLLRRVGAAPRVSPHTVPTVAAGTLRPSFRLVAIMVRASVRMKRGALEWRESLKLHHKVQEGLEELRRKRALKARSSRESIENREDDSGIVIDEVEDEDAVSCMQRRLLEGVGKSPRRVPGAKTYPAEIICSKPRHNTEVNPAMHGQKVDGRLDELRVRIEGHGGREGWEGVVVRSQKEKSDRRKSSLRKSSGKKSGGFEV